MDSVVKTSEERWKTVPGEAITAADERLYRFDEICRLSMEGRGDEAFKRMQIQALFLHKNRDEKLFALFLNALNQAHYHLFLNRFGLSLHGLCFYNNELYGRASSQAGFLEAGRKIIESYSEAALRLRSEHNKAVARAVSFIKENIDQDLSLQRIADEVFLNKTYFCTLFREVTGQNISHFIRRERMREAERLLLGSDMRIEDIAKNCGFSSPAYFSTVFRQFFRMQPSEYRAENREIA